MKKVKIISVLLAVFILVSNSFTVVMANERKKTGVLSFEVNKKGIFSHSYLQHKLQKYMSDSKKQDSVHKKSIKLHGGIKSNNCVYFASEALRRVGVNIPKNIAYTTNLEKELVKRGWVKSTNISDMQPGDVAFASVYHTYIFMQWADNDTAYIVDNQSDYFGRTLHLRDVFKRGEGGTNPTTHFYRYTGNAPSKSLGNDVYVIPETPTYALNAKVISNKSAKLRDANGKSIPGRKIEKGDKISIVEAFPSKNLVEVIYKSGLGWTHGYANIKLLNNVKFAYKNKWIGDDTASNVYYDSNLNKYMTCLKAFEKATPLHYTDGKLHILFKYKGKWQSGYVRYSGGFGGKPNK